MEQRKFPEDNLTLLPISAVCKRLSVSRSSFYKLVGAEKIKAVRIGRSIRVEAREVDRFIQSLSEE